MRAPLPGERQIVRFSSTGSMMSPSKSHWADCALGLRRLPTSELSPRGGGFPALECIRGRADLLPGTKKFLGLIGRFGFNVNLKFIRHYDLR
jgi:hypothetical protein